MSGGAARRAARGAALRAGVPSGDPLAPGHPTDPATDAERARALAFAEGYNLAGVASAEPGADLDRLHEAIARGHVGSMTYLSERAAQRTNPRALAPWARSVLVAGLFYETPLPHTADALAEAHAHGADPVWISRYAWGRDYHNLLWRMNRRLVRRLKGAFGADRRLLQYADTGPVMEKALGARAGLGWIGKNTQLTNPLAGSFFFLGVVLTDLDLEPSTPLPDRCGACTECLDACPTAAFPEPYVLDARRCISYRTVESREPKLPEDLATGLAPHLFGCDLCQDACPYNAKSPMSVLEAFRPRDPGLAPERRGVLELLADPEQAAERLQGSPMRRAGADGLRRVLGWHGEDPR